ncbi:MAG: thymidine phosphorylase [Coriobacteriia bacterium]
MTAFSFEELIEVKRDGGTHDAAQMDRIVLGHASGEMPDYQMSAWLMAAFLNGLSAEETVWLTDAMVRSGEVMDLSSIPGIKVDKHSTGGVADTTTLVLAPLVAACGVPVAKMSGRGLGHTGGTLDKLESIPGFSVELSPDDFISQVRRIGVAVIAQSPSIDPADKKMYALRDVTATVPSIPLIVGSIISKKIAGGADAIVLDVKVGSGAFMKTEADARALASELVRVGNAIGCRVVAIMTDMDQPLGNAIGNALEVREAIQVLSGAGPMALREVVLALGSRMLLLADAAGDADDARSKLESAIASGAGLRKFGEWVRAQGGNSDIVTDPEVLPRAAFSRVVRAREAGHVASYDAEGIGRAAMVLGAGRARKEDAIDPAAGIQLLRRVGDEVERDEPLAMIYGGNELRLAEANDRFLRSVRMSADPVTPPPLFHEL